MLDDFGKTTGSRISDENLPRGTGRDADLARFVTYWETMRRGGDVPMRTNIDPRGIESLLGNAFIAEKVAPGLARLRIAGAVLSDVMGMEVRGMPLSSLIEPGDRMQLADALVELFERPAQLRLELASPGGIRRAAMAATLVILPLRSDLGDISRALGCFVTSGPIGNAPRRFRILECKVTPVAIRERAQNLGFAEEQARYFPSTKPAAQTEKPVSLKPALPSHHVLPKTAPARSEKQSGLKSERPYLKLVHSS